MVKYHTMYSLFLAFKEVIEKTQFKDPKVKENLTNLCILLALTELQKDPKTLYDCGYFGQGTSDLLDEATNIIMDKIRP